MKFYEVVRALKARPFYKKLIRKINENYLDINTDNELK